MYIEVLYNIQGNIDTCFCVDTLPADSKMKFFEVQGEMPQDLTHCRINIDTLTAMEIDTNSDLQNKERSQYIKANFNVDLVTMISVPDSVEMPEGMDIKNITRK